MTCTFCGGVAHPATGSVYGSRTIACGPCERRFWQWFRGHQAPRKGRPSFYDAAAMWKPEVKAAEKSRLAQQLLAVWGKLPHYRGTIALVQRLARLTLEG